MAVAIRLTRFGGKKKPFYRIVVADSRKPRDGRALEVLGHYDPRKGAEKGGLKLERFKYWLGCGARPSEIVQKIFKKASAGRGAAA